MAPRSSSTTPRITPTTGSSSASKAHSNRVGIGAKIHLSTATGYASSSDPRVHFGLGPAASAREISIDWPSGIHQTLHNVPSNRILDITEPTR